MSSTPGEDVDSTTTTATATPEEKHLTPSFLRLRNDAAVKLLRADGKLRLAFEALRSVVDAFERRGEQTHPDALTALQNIGVVRQELAGRPGDLEALRFLRRAAHGRATVLGVGHADALDSVLQCAMALRTAAEAHLREETAESSFGSFLLQEAELLLRRALKGTHDRQTLAGTALPPLSAGASDTDTSFKLRRELARNFEIAHRRQEALGVFETIRAESLKAWGGSGC